ncbi:TPA_asm: P3 [Schiedea betacytorhabdovirus 1]|nr:TPA_asm: P3 [Schiedea betacytorhabdovirus 1]
MKIEERFQPAKIPIRSEINQEEAIVKFPFRVFGTLSKANYVGISSIFISYTPIIHNVNHGSIKLQIKDKRQLFDNLGIVSEITFLTNVKQQVELSGFDYASSVESSPFSVILSTELRSIAPDYSVGKLQIIPRFTYTKKDPPRCVPKVKSVYCSYDKVTGTEDNKRYIVEEGKRMIVNFHNSVDHKISPQNDVSSLKDSGYNVIMQ